MIIKEYRLEDYIIAEYDGYMYTWEMNMVLGEHRIGNCFMVDDLLILEPWTHKKEGCLKLEYHERLRKLPIWNKSQYYCFSHSLRNPGTAQPLSNYFNRQQADKNEIVIESVKPLEPGRFCLARYKLMVEENGVISWQICEELNKIRGGPCIIESGILFLCPTHDTVYERQTKKEWSIQLSSLPKWDKTFAWGHWNILRDCVQEKKVNKIVSLPWNSDLKKKRIPDDMQNSKRQGHTKKRNAKPLLSHLGHLRTSLYDTEKFVGSILSSVYRRAPVYGMQFLYFFKKIVLWGAKLKVFLLNAIKSKK